MANASRDGRAAVKQIGRSAAITGAGSGLDRDIALGLAEKGYEVFGTVTKEADLQAADARIRLSLCDIAKEQDVKAWAASVSAALGDSRGLDLLISNAGISTWTASLPLPFNGPSGASKAAMETSQGRTISTAPEVQGIARAVPR